MQKKFRFANITVGVMKISQSTESNIYSSNDLKLFDKNLTILENNESM